MGNEAADLDSMASAVAYAWYLNLNDSSVNAFPLINIPRADFKLRTEAVFLFKEAGIDIDLLLFAEDVDLKRLDAAGNLSLILVDHNKIAANQVDLEHSITAIMDHHADEKSYPQNAVTDIRPVGSTTTIVAESFLSNQKEEMSPALATLLMGTILLDTVNLSKDAGRVTDDDIRIVSEMQKVVNLNIAELFAKLQFEKFNVSSLGSYDLLRKDYKEWQMGAIKCGIGAVLQPIEAWIKKDPDVEEACAGFAKEKNLDVLFAMNAFTNPDFTRQMVLFIPNTDLREKTRKFLEQSDLGLTQIANPGLSKNDVCLLYNQANLGISRKKLQPLLNNFFSEM
jgi:exopolyphosphatase